MDALFGVFFILYILASVIAAVSRAGKGKPGGAGAPWPRIPPLHLPEGSGGPPALPIPGAWQEEEASERGEEGTSSVEEGEPSAEEGGPSAEERDLSTERREPTPVREMPGEGEPGDEWATLEGETLEWADLETDEERGRLAPGARTRRGAAAEREIPWAVARGTQAPCWLSEADLVRAVVMSEVLGPPRAVRSRRFRAV